LQYRDYSLWQQESVTEEALRSQLEYWKRRLDGAPMLLRLPLDRARKTTGISAGGYASLVISKPIYDKLIALGQREGVTLFVLLLAAFQVLLSYYSGAEDVVVGTDISRRNSLEAEELIGFFINQLVIRSDMSADPDFSALLKRVRATALEAYANQDVPFERVVDAVLRDRDPGYSPLFQAKIVVQQFKGFGPEMTGLKVQHIDAGDRVAQLDIILNMVADEDQLVGVLEYNADLFDPQTASSIAHGFERTLAIVAEGEVKLSEIKAMLASEEEKERRRRAEDLKRARLRKFESMKEEATRV
ncbi:MAG: condensation domain-containing protein, partial [Blastocatellia bacterium]